MPLATFGAGGDLWAWVTCSYPLVRGRRKVA